MPLARHFGVEPEHESPPALQTATPSTESTTQVALQSVVLRHSMSLAATPPVVTAGGWHSMQIPTPLEPPAVETIQ